MVQGTVIHPLLLLFLAPCPSPIPCAYMLPTQNSRGLAEVGKTAQGEKGATPSPSAPWTQSKLGVASATDIFLNVFRKIHSHISWLYI